MRVRILERGAKTISEAYTIAARHEAYVASASTPAHGPASSSSSSDDSSRRARVVGVPEQLSLSERRIAALEKSIQTMADDDTDAEIDTDDDAACRCATVANVDAASKQILTTCTVWEDHNTPMTVLDLCFADHVTRNCDQAVTEGQLLFETVVNARGAIRPDGTLLVRLPGRSTPSSSHQGR